MGCPTRRVGRVGPAALPRSAACGTSPFVEQPQPQLCLPSNHFHPELASVVVAGERMTQYSGCAPPMCSSVPSSISPSYIDLILRLGCNAVDHLGSNDFTPSHRCPPKLYHAHSGYANRVFSRPYPNATMWSFPTALTTTITLIFF